MIKSVSLVFFLICLIVAGCSTTKPLFIVPDYSERQPKFIAVLPVEDTRQVKGENPKLEGILIEALRDRWYQVRDMKQTYMLLERADISHEEIVSLEPTKLCRVLNVDAVLKSKLYEYEKQLASGRNRLKMDFLLIERREGEILWKEHVDKPSRSIAVVPPLSYPIRDWIKSAFRSLPAAKT